MTTQKHPLVFPQPVTSEWIVAYQTACLAAKDVTTREAYLRILRQFGEFVARLPGMGHTFQPALLTPTVVERYLTALKEQGYSVSHRSRVKSVLKQFCQWLIEERGVLSRNPTRGLEVNAQEILTPRVLSPEQRFVLCHLADQYADLRGQAIFALGYWAGCRVSDVSHLLLVHTHIGPKLGWLRVGYKGEKWREIDLLNEARRPLYFYLQHGGRDERSPYVFTSQRSLHLTEYGIHQWFRTLKQQATKDQWDLIGNVTFHDLRHDFAHRARDAGWTLEEVAYYLGHVTRRGTPAIQTTIRYTQVSRAQVREKLRLLRE
jgi:site-specific recombinase XerD